MLYRLTDIEGWIGRRGGGRDKEKGDVRIEKKGEKQGKGEIKKD